MLVAGEAREERLLADVVPPVHPPALDVVLVRRAVDLIETFTPSPLPSWIACHTGPCAGRSGGSGSSMST